MSYVRFTVCNTFITNIEGNSIQQVVGIPMGTNSAPAIANLTLYASEAQFMDTLYRIDPQNAKNMLSRFDIDKTVNWDLPIIRFPHYHSNTPSHQIIGVMLGQFTRYNRICNTVTSLKLLLQILYHTFCIDVTLIQLSLNLGKDLLQNITIVRI